MFARLSDAIGALLAAGIRTWVRLTGRRVAKQTAPWLRCPMGPPGRIGAQFYDYFVKHDGLRIEPSPNAGLLPSFDALKGRKGVKGEKMGRKGVRNRFGDDAGRRGE